MSVFVQFKDPSSGRASHVYGPYPDVQLTYGRLCVGPNGDTLAIGPELWAPLDSKGRRESNVSYSDVIISDDFF